MSGWYNPEDPRTWSGVPYGVVAELQRLGIYAGSTSALPWMPAASAIHRWRSATHRMSERWTLSADMRALSTFTDAVRRTRSRHDVDGWVHFVGGHGPVVATRFVTLFDMSPSQLQEACGKWARSFGYPDPSARELAWVARRQQFAYERAHACCVPSHWTADSLIRDHGIDARKVHIVGYGRNVTMARPSDRDWSVPRFLFVGRDWRRKNGDAVVRSFARLRRSVPAAQLDVVGDHPRIDEPGVHEHGLLSLDVADERAQLEALFAAATCLVGPSILEPFGIVHVEAATAGVPSIATSIGGAADAVGPGGVLVDPYDDEGIHQAMRRMSDPDVARELGDLAFDRSGAFTWPAVGQRVVRALDLGADLHDDLAEYL